LTHQPFFKWETMKELGPYVLHYADPIPGKLYEIELTTGKTIHLWQADNGQDYFCHCLTFGGKDAPVGGPVSPLGDYVPSILREYYEPVIPEGQGQPGDILVWRGIDANEVMHSAILSQVVPTRKKTYLDSSSELQTKNGREPETIMTLEELIVDYYGESYNVFRRK
jgi:hypothetical protein